MVRIQILLGQWLLKYTPLEKFYPKLLHYGSTNGPTNKRGGIKRIVSRVYTYTSYQEENEVENKLHVDDVVFNFGGRETLV